MAKREFLQLAHNFEPAKVGVGSWFMSEKLDGMRCFWDGGITRGHFADEVPFANVEKDGRYLQRLKSTGLWSRYGKTIQAPDWWIDALPNMLLDGELYIGRNSFQELTSTVKQIIPDMRWKNVKFHVFDSPHLEVVFQPGVINNTNFKKTFNKETLAWVTEQALLRKGLRTFKFSFGYESVKAILEKNLGVGVAVFHEQIMLDARSPVALEQVYAKLEEVCSAGGEGLMLRKPNMSWVPERTRNLLKVKQMQDAEGIVTGYIWGRETDLGSKLLGLMGALVLDFNGKRLELSGFTDEERILTYTSGKRATNEGIANPGKEVGDGIFNPNFPKGSKVTFRYRELTDAGIPKEARYWRRDL